MKIRVSLAILLVLLGFSACKKQDGNIIIDGQSNNNQLDIFRADTFTLLTKTIREDSLPGNGINYSLLGEMNDPILGKSKASLFAKMMILEPENNFPNSIEPDSAILYIPMVDGLNFYGNPSPNNGFKYSHCQKQSQVPRYTTNIKTSLTINKSVAITLVRCINKSLIRLGIAKKNGIEAWHHDQVER